VQRGYGTRAALACCGLGIAWLYTLGCSADIAAPPKYTGPTPTKPESLLVWQDSLVASNARPAFDSHSVYFLANHVAYAVDKITGAPLWSTTFTYPPTVSVELPGYGTGVVAGHVIMGDIDIFGLDPATGAVDWRFAPRLTFKNEQAYFRFGNDGTTIYAGGLWGNVYAVDAATGQQKWLTHVTTLPDSFVQVFNPVVAHGVVYTAFTDASLGPLNPERDGGVAAIDAVSGRLLWSQYLPHHFGLPNNQAVAVAITPTRIVTGDLNGFLYGLDPQTGAIIDTVSQIIFGVPAGSSLAGFFNFTVADTVLAVSANTVLIALDTRNLQRKLWTAEYGQGTINDMTGDSARVYAAYAGGQIAVFDMRTGLLVWTMTNHEFRPNQEHFIWNAAVDGNRVYLGSDHDVYAFKWY
jgi:outer membrane protein assembly factor BamB